MRKNVSLNIDSSRDLAQYQSFLSQFKNTSLRYVVRRLLRLYGLLRTKRKLYHNPLLYNEFLIKEGIQKKDNKKTV
jgi:hypothetical protein